VFNDAPIIQLNSWAILASAVAPGAVLPRDCPEITNVGRDAGAKITLTVTAESANEHAGIAPFILHNLEQLQARVDTLMMCLPPNLSIITERHLQGFAVTPHYLNGVNVNVGRERETIMAKPFLPYRLPDWASVEIDEPANWVASEAPHEAFVVRAP
jgi:CMP-N-acetylneuraminic acid synthetase